MRDIGSVFEYFNGASFPDYTGEDASAADQVDGTEWNAIMIDDYIWGWTQNILDKVGMIPDGNAESSSASQIVDALALALSPVGCEMMWNRSDDPASITYGTQTVKARFLILDGSYVLAADYADLVTACGTTNSTENAARHTASAGYYRTSDVGGTTPDVAGAYFWLPDSQGYGVRGITTDTAVDPDATRLMGELQNDAFQGHWHNIVNSTATGSGIGVVIGVTGISDSTKVLAPVTDGVNGTPRTAIETRMKNRAVKFAVRY